MTAYLISQSIIWLALTIFAIVVAITVCDDPKNRRPIILWGMVIAFGIAQTVIPLIL